MAKSRKTIKNVTLKISEESTRLRILRKSKDLSQQKVSDYIGVHQTTLQKYEAGLANPSPDKLAKLAELFGVTTDYLLGREINTEGLSEMANKMLVMGCQVTYHEIMQVVASDPKKIGAFKKYLEDFKKEL